jgi:GMP synthase (glutamine-hydrolysing)
MPLSLPHGGDETTTMQPVLILQHLSGDGPAYLATWLRRNGVAYRVFDTEAGDAFPASMSGYSALAVLGGEMSANDDLASLRQAEALIRDAMGQARPVIGHCLGGQLMARALGCRVVESPAPEVGWQPIRCCEGPEPQRWFGSVSTPTVFQWHYEAFELPREATLLASSAACPHQAFAIGPHLGMQFHIEVDAEKVARWSREEGPRWAAARAAHPGSVQDGAAMREGLAAELPRHHSLADRIYGRWLAGIARA